MLRKLLACFNFALFLMAFSQCDRCTTNPVEDITKWELVWDKAVALGSSLPSVDVTKSIVCHVPSEDAVYFLAPTGECHRFTQTSGLMHERIASFSGISGQELFFAFPAGTIQAQTLHVGIVNQQKITLQQYKEGTWQPVGSYNFDSTTAWPSSSSVTACSIHEENQCNGLIVLRPNSHGIAPVVLCYDADKRTLESSSTWRYMGYDAPKVAIAIAPGAVLLSERTGALYCWAEKGNKYEHVQVPAYAYCSPSERLNLFLLHAKKLMPQVVLANFVKKNGNTELQFSTMTHTYPHTMQPSHDLPEEEEDTNSAAAADNRIDHSQSLVLPFSEMVYVVTKDKDGKSVYYKGSFQKPTKREE